MDEDVPGLDSNYIRAERWCRRRRDLWNGKAVIPSQFANKVTNSNRNAWRDLYVKRPSDGIWILADTSLAPNRGRGLTVATKDTKRPDGEYWPII